MGVNDLVPAARVPTSATGARTTPTRLRALVVLLLSTVVLTGCGAASSGAAASAAPSAATTIDTESEAAEAVVQQNRLFAGIGPLESDAIGQANYWEADDTEDGYRVRYTVGWGDCMAGCIQRREFTYEVTRTGAVRLVDERGDAIPADVLEKLARGAGGGSAQQGVTGRVVGGPVCPVEQPNDPACDPRPVPGAVLLLRSADGSELVVTTDESGLFSVELPAGEYVIEAQQLDGYVAPPQPIAVVVEEGGSTEVELEYDTGIR
jgi:hypothetical protein